jgi:hypothetical protein
VTLCQTEKVNECWCWFSEECHEEISVTWCCSYVRAVGAGCLGCLLARNTARFVHRSFGWRFGGYPPEQVRSPPEMSPNGVTSSGGILAACRRKDLDLGNPEPQAVSEPLDGRGGMKRSYRTERVQRALIREANYAGGTSRRFSLSTL